jgi:hypothetical protein
LVNPLEFEADTMFQGLTLNTDGLKYDSYMELLEYFSHFLPELDIGSPERRALSSTE